MALNNRVLYWVRCVNALAVVLALLSFITCCSQEEGKAEGRSPQFIGANGIIDLDEIMAGEVGKYVTLTPYSPACVRRLDARSENPPLIPSVPFDGQAIQKELGFAPKRSEEKTLFEGNPAYNDVLTWELPGEGDQDDQAESARSSVTAVARDECVYWVGAEFTDMVPAEEAVAHVGVIPLTRDFQSLVVVLGAPSVSSGSRLRTFRCQWSIVSGVAPNRIYMVVYAAVKDMLVKSMFVNLFYETEE